MREIFRDLKSALASAQRAGRSGLRGAEHVAAGAGASGERARSGFVPPGSSGLKYRDLIRLSPFLRPHWRLGATAVAASVVSALLFAAIPLSLKYVADEAVSGGNYGLLNLIIGLVVGVLAVIALADFVKQFYFFRFQQEAIYDIQCAILRKLFSLPKSFFDSSSTGYLMSRGVGDAMQLQIFFSSTLVDVLTRCLQLLIAVGVLVYLHWKLMLVSLVVMPLFALASRVISAQSRRLSHASLEKSALVTRDLEENLSAALLIKAFAAEEREGQKLESRLRDALSANHHRLVATSFFSFLSSVINAFGMGLVIWYGAMLIIKKELTPGELLTFCAYLGLLIQPAKFLANLNNTFQFAFAALERVFEILALVTEGESEKRKIKLEKVRGNVRFEKVSFSYDGVNEVLRDIDFEAEPGQIVALVGPSGAGKSTLVNLILGLYRPSAGQIFIDGAPATEIDLKSLRSRIGLVSQEVLLLNETIKSNVRYGRHDASDEEVERAARIAGAHEFICELPDGYETRVGEKGVRLSVGQKQRLAIARAILKDPDIFIFDEATSALDAITEEVVKMMLREFCRGRTVFVIAHHLSTVVQSDVILTLSGGRIVQRGTHEELSSQVGLYRQLSLTQLAGPGPAMPPNVTGAATSLGG